MAPSLIARQDISCNGAIVVAGIATLKDTTNISGGLFTTGASKFYNNLDVTSNTNISGGLFVTGASQFYNTLGVSNLLTGSNGVAFTGSTSHTASTMNTIGCVTMDTSGSYALNIQSGGVNCLGTINCLDINMNGANLYVGGGAIIGSLYFKQTFSISNLAAYVSTPAYKIVVPNNGTNHILYFTLTYTSVCTNSNDGLVNSTYNDYSLFLNGVPDSLNGSGVVNQTEFSAGSVSGSTISANYEHTITSRNINVTYTIEIISTAGVTVTQS